MTGSYGSLKNIVFHHHIWTIKMSEYIIIVYTIHDFYDKNNQTLYF